MKRKAKFAVLFLVLVFSVGAAFADCTLIIGNASGLPNWTVQLLMTLNCTDGQWPAALQWTIQHSKLLAVSQRVGPVAIAADKQLYCNTRSADGAPITKTSCLLVGVNAYTIFVGGVLVLDVALGSGFSGSGLIVFSTDKSLLPPLGASLEGDGINITGIGGGVRRSLTALSASVPGRSAAAAQDKLPMDLQLFDQIGVMGFSCDREALKIGESAKCDLLLTEPVKDRLEVLVFMTPDNSLAIAKESRLVEPIPLNPGEPPRNSKRILAIEPGQQTLEFTATMTEAVGPVPYSALVLQLKGDVFYAVFNVQR